MKASIKTFLNENDLGEIGLKTVIGLGMMFTVFGFAYLLATGTVWFMILLAVACFLGAAYMIGGLALRDFRERKDNDR